MPTPGSPVELRRGHLDGRVGDTDSGRPGPHGRHQGTLHRLRRQERQGAPQEASRRSAAVSSPTRSAACSMFAVAASDRAVLDRAAHASPNEPPGESTEPVRSGATHRHEPEAFAARGIRHERADLEPGPEASRGASVPRDRVRRRLDGRGLAPCWIRSLPTPMCCGATP